MKDDLIGRCEYSGKINDDLNDLGEKVERYKKLIEEAEPDVPDIRVGKWIPWRYHNGFRCENCNEPVDNKYNYCPNCGAYMREGDAE